MYTHILYTFRYNVFAQVADVHGEPVGDGGHRPSIRRGRRPAEGSPRGSLQGGVSTLLSGVYKGTSLIRKSPPLGLYNRPIPGPL